MACRPGAAVAAATGHRGWSVGAAWITVGVLEVEQLHGLGDLDDFPGLRPGGPQPGADGLDVAHAEGERGVAAAVQLLVGLGLAQASEY